MRPRKAWSYGEKQEKHDINSSTLLPLPSFIKDHLVVPSTSTSLHLGSRWLDPAMWITVTYPSPSQQSHNVKLLESLVPHFAGWEVGKGAMFEHAHKLLDNSGHSIINTGYWLKILNPLPRARHLNCIGPASPLTPTVHRPFTTANICKHGFLSQTYKNPVKSSHSIFSILNASHQLLTSG